MNTFRHPGTMRLFTNTGILILCGYGWQQFATGRDKQVKRVILVLLVAVILSTFISLLFQNTRKDFSYFFQHEWSRTHIKYLLSVSTFSVWLFIGGMIQTLTLLAVFLLKRKFMITVSIINLFIMTFLSMPFTMVSQYRPSQVNHAIQLSPDGFPWDKAMLNVTDEIDNPFSLTAFGYDAFYTKQISLQEHLISPTINTRYNEMLHDTLLRKELIQHPFIYSNSTDSISVTSFTPNAFTISGNGKNTDTIYIIQQFNKNWKATSGNATLPVELAKKAFMSVTVPKGKWDFKLEYRPYSIVIASCISLLLLIGCTGSLIYFRAIRL
jgi:hypothetical protein